MADPNSLVQQWARIAQVLYCPHCNAMIDTEVYQEMAREEGRTVISCDDCGAQVPLDSWAISSESQPDADPER